MINAAHCRAARALLDWTQAQLATATGLTLPTIRAFEKGGMETRSSTEMVIRLALEAQGIRFTGADGNECVCRSPMPMTGEANE